MSSFEEARFHGYSIGDLIADEAEATQRMQAMGCFSCKYGKDLRRTCEAVLEGGYKKCPYRKAV